MSNDESRERLFIHQEGLAGVTPPATVLYKGKPSKQIQKILNCQVLVPCPVP